MANERNLPENTVYELKLKGHLSNQWADRFEGFQFTHEEDGTTTMVGLVIDQAALHGLLKRIRDLGLPLLSINQLDKDVSVDQET